MDYKFYSSGKVIKTIPAILVLSTLGCGAAKVENPKTEHLEAALVSEVTTIQPGVPFWVGLKLKMEDGWHVNWKNPGDAGLAPTINWELPEGFTAGEIQWPIPERLLVSDFVLFGYEGTVLLPVEITPPATFDKKEVSITAVCDWVVCGEVCVPGEAKLSLEIPVGSETVTYNSQSVKEFEATRNKTAKVNDKLDLRASSTEHDIVLSIIPDTNLNQTIEGLVFFPDKQGIINNAAVQEFSKTANGYLLEIARDKMGQSLPESLDGILVFKYLGVTPPKEGIIVSIPLEKSVSVRN